jgi:hypothetical protein
MHCPVCRSEYQDGVVQCPDDGAELVDRLSLSDGVPDDSEARFLPLHTLSSPAEAEMVNDILLQNGIRSAVQSGASDALSPLLSATAPGAVLLVDERDFDRAQELYQAFFGEDTSPLTGGTLDSDEQSS